MRSRSTIAILAALTVAAVTLAAAPSRAAAASSRSAAAPRLALSRTAAVPGARVVLSGHRFGTHARVRVTFAGRTVRRGRAGRHGGFRLAFRVPASAPGLYRVRARVRGKTVASRRFRIQSTPGPAPALPAPQEPAPSPLEPPPQQEPAPPPPPPPPPDPPTVVAAGDIACSPTQTPGDTTCHQSQTADLIGQLGPDAVAPLGDNQYEHGELANFNSMYDPTWGRFKAMTFPAVGNHEYEGDPERDSAPGYFAYFGLRAGDPSNGYYRWSLGGWTIFVLNSGAIDYTRTGAGSTLPDDCWPVSCATGSEQLDWLTGELDALADDACVLAYWHHPRFSSGYNGINRDYPETGAMYEALYEHGAELLLNGHAHNYERFEPVDPAGGSDATNGITNFVVGTGGRSLFTQPGDQEDISETLYTDAFGVLELTLEPDGWTSRFVTDTGETRDAAGGSCHRPPPA